jgi:hypothetical protein
LRTPLAYNLTRKEIHYRHDAFSAGLEAAGFAVRDQVGRPQAGDVLLIWNRYGAMHDIATQFELQGGIVLVAENGYVGPGGISPHSMNPRSIFALARGAHNGAGRWSVGEARFHALGVTLKAWRKTGEHVLVCPNRSFGKPGMIMPREWAHDVCKALAASTKREIRLRPHPGNSPPSIPLADDLRGAWAVVIWASSAGVHALLAGVPVFQFAPHWICEDAAAKPGTNLEDPQMDETARLRAFERLAWAQWSIDEIQTGEPIRRLLA